MKKSAVFLDRDGTLNIDPGYLSDPSQMSLFPGVARGLARLQSAGFELVVVTNQSGVARGLIQESQLPRIHSRLNELLASEGGEEAKIAHFEYCPKLPEDPDSRRKPKPDLILDAARKLHLEPAKSWMIGDRISDLESGRAAGCRGVILVLTGEGKISAEKLQIGKTGGSKTAAVVPDFVCDSLEKAADFILSQTQGY